MSSTSLSSAGSALRSMMPRFMRKKQPGFSRRHERHHVVVLANMKVIEIGADFDGVVIEISAGGCAFRPASMFILDRTGEVVSIRTDTFEIEGRIRAVRPGSYGIQFFQDLDQAAVDDMVRRFGGRIADSYLAKRA